jgi:hypothetical protein
VEISRSEIKQVDIFSYVGSVVEKDGEIWYEINKRIRKASKFYYLIRSILWNKDIDRKGGHNIQDVL